MGSVQSIGPALWPPALKAMRKPCSAASPTVAATSSADSRVDDGDRPLVDGEVPRLSRRVPGRVAGQHDVAIDAGTQVQELHGRSRDTEADLVEASERR